MKTFFPALSGNEPLRHAAGSAVMNGTLSHAYLIEGADGTGKMFFARQTAAAALCENRGNTAYPLPCGQCPACRKILETGTPDLTLISRGDAATIGVDLIREIKQDMYLSPTEFQKKIYIIDEAERMTTQAQNALLIALEEPPTDVLIFLLCSDASSLLTTVRSRVQTWRMARFTTKELQDFLLAQDRRAATLKADDPARFSELLAAAEGSPGAALALLDRRALDALLSRRATVTSLLDALAARGRYADLYDVVSHLPNKRPELAEFLRLFSLALRDLILIKRDGNVPLCFFADREEAETRSATFSLRGLFAVTDAVNALNEDLARNANVNVLLSSFTDVLRNVPSR